MDVDLTRVQEKNIDKGFFKQMIGRKAHIEIEFTIEAVLGPAEVSFQCCKWYPPAIKRTLKGL